MKWFNIAKELPQGRSRRLDCNECRGIKTMSVSNLGDNLTFHCFRCKIGGSKSPPPMTPQERRALEKATETFKSIEPSIPTDFTLDIPTGGLVWLTRGGLHLEDIQRYGFGWSNKLKRVIMPVYDNNKLVAVQARSISKYVLPKYLTRMDSRRRPVFKANHLSTNTNRHICLTEDILSAIRVGKVSEAWSLMGTNLMQSVIAELLSIKNLRVSLWLDEDKAGIFARRRMLIHLQAVGIKTRLIVSNKDPKLHTIEEIKELLNGTYKE